MELYWVAVILNPTDKQKFDDGTVPMLVVEPKAVLAKDEKQASAKAFKLVPEEHEGKVDRLEVLVAPFRANVFAR